MQLLKKFYIKHQGDEDGKLSLSGSDKDIKMSPYTSPKKPKSMGSTGGSIDNVMD